MTLELHDIIGGFHVPSSRRSSSSSCCCCCCSTLVLGVDLDCLYKDLPNARSPHHLEALSTQFEKNVCTSVCAYV